MYLHNSEICSRQAAEQQRSLQVKLLLDWPKRSDRQDVWAQEPCGTFWQLRPHSAMPLLNSMQSHNSVRSFKHHELLHHAARDSA